MMIEALVVILMLAVFWMIVRASNPKHGGKHPPNHPPTPPARDRPPHSDSVASTSPADPPSTLGYKVYHETQEERDARLRQHYESVKIELTEGQKRYLRKVCRGK